MESLQSRRPFANPWSVFAGIAVVVWLGAYWLFGWGYPSRLETELFFQFSYDENGLQVVFRDDGSEVAIGKAGIQSIEEIECHSESRRRLPSILYYCFYGLRAPSGEHYSAVIAAQHNRGWKRLNMADVGDYRLVYLSPANKRETFARYDRPLPDAKQGNP